MKLRISEGQNGFALLIFLIALMGLGGIALTGFSQQALKSVEKKRFEHNREVLQEAKHALLMYAYRYPEISTIGGNPPRGPGRMPCPYDQENGYSGLPTLLMCQSVGRLPWGNNLNTRRLQDASGEDLWYAVSSGFYNPVWGPATINSDSLGTITVFDQSGGLRYAGATDGIAAIIIAPGPPVRRDENNDGVYEYSQVRNTIAQRADPRNYLDTLGNFDNSDYVNVSNAAADGFILGPVFDPNQSDIVINDQMIVITTDEVIAMAEKATLRAYSDALAEYRTNIGGIDTYPWLDSYGTTDALTTYDAEVTTRVGLVPSTFADYFTGPIPNPSQPIISNLDMEIIGNLTINGFPVPLIDPDVISANASVVFNAAGDLTITPAVSTQVVRFYWDEVISPDGWQECLPANTGTERDCNQAFANPGVPDSSIFPNQFATRVVRVDYANLVASTPFTRLFAGSAGNPLQYAAPTAIDHAYVFFEYAEAAVDAIGVDYQYDSFYDLNFISELSGNLNYRLGVRYYPVLPTWALAAENDWHNSIQMAYSIAYQPPGAVALCSPGGGGLPCLTVNNTGGVVSDKEALLTIASDHGLTDPGGDGFISGGDLAQIFDSTEHTDLNDTYDARIAAGNDTVFILDGRL